MDQKRKFRAIAGVLHSGEETPRRGEGPCGNKGSPRGIEAEREGWPGLGFATTKLSFAATKGFPAAKPLFTAWKCCVFVSFYFSVVS